MSELRARSQKHRSRLSWERVKSAFLTRSMRESMENLHRQCQILNGLVLIDAATLGAATHNEVKEARVENKLWQESEESQRIISWLSEANPGLQLSDNLRLREEGTGTWIFNSDQYKSWLASDGSTLFCPGVPGAGKTVATAIVVDELYRKFLDDDSIGITFAFCNVHQRNARKEDILATLLKQLACKGTSLSTAVSDLYKIHKQTGTRPSYDDLSQTLRATVSQRLKTFVILDALDEGWVPGGSLEKIMSTVFELQDEYPIHFLCTSRFIPDISEEFENKGSSTLEIRAHVQDIEKYLEGHVSDLPSFVTKSEELRKEVIRGIVHVVDGM